MKRQVMSVKNNDYLSAFSISVLTDMLLLKASPFSEQFNHVLLLYGHHCPQEKPLQLPKKTLRHVQEVNDVCEQTHQVEKHLAFIKKTLRWASAGFIRPRPGMVWEKWEPVGMRVSSYWSFFYY